ncbi:MAG: 23S rRNA (pseudouridine(1915)-N(3))-methyltransferase RlmH [Pseudomonadota bacterium]
MRIQILAVGRLRNGPEKALIDDYITRFDRTGRALGLGPLNVIEVEDRKNQGQKAEADLLVKSTPAGAYRIILDERGKSLSSPKFAKAIAQRRDQGVGDLSFWIGGADGHLPHMRDQADEALSFGQMVWPHMLARVMLTEQLYRTASILAGSPYHRD